MLIESQPQPFYVELLKVEKTTPILLVHIEILKNKSNQLNQTCCQ